MVADNSTLGLPDGDLATLIARSGIRRIHVLAWRDLDDPESGGSEIHAHKIISYWAAAGLDVTTRTSRAINRPLVGNRDGYRYVRRGGRFTSFPRAILGEIVGFHGSRDAIVEIWNGVPFLTPVWARGPRIALLHHQHERLWPTVRPRVVASLGSLVERRLAPPLYRSTPIVTLSASSQCELTEKLKLRQDMVHVVEPGVSPDFNSGGVRSSNPLVVAVGRLVPYKGVDSLIEATYKVRTRIPNVQLEIIGTGPFEGELRGLVARLGAEAWIHFRGRISDEELVDTYRRAWVVASASLSEGWGMSLTEAARCGTPAVATRISGHVDAVAEGVSGFLVDDQFELVERLVQLVSDSELRNKLCGSAEEWSARFDWERSATETFRVLASTALRG